MKTTKSGKNIKADLNYYKFKIYILKGHILKNFRFNDF